MFHIYCTCGAHLALLNEQIAQRTICPKCGARIADVLSVAAPSSEAPSPPAAPRIVVPPRRTAPTPAEPSPPPTPPQVMTAPVSASEPKGLRADAAETKSMEKQVGDTMAKVGKYLKFVGVPVLIVAVAAGGYSLFRSLTGGKGQAAASMSISSDIDVLRARIVKPYTFVAQAQDELFCAAPFMRQKVWTVDLKSMEEKPAATPAVGAGSPERDRLRFAALGGSNAVVHSSRQLLDFDVNDGKLKWRLFEAGEKFPSVTVHEGGVLCIQQTASESRLVNFAFADGARQWTAPGNFASLTEPIIFNGHCVLLTQEGQGNPPQLYRKSQTKPRRVIEGDDEHPSVELGRETLEEVSVP